MTKVCIFCKPRSFVFVCILGCIIYSTTLLFIAPFRQTKTQFKREYNTPSRGKTQYDFIEDFAIIDQLPENAVATKIEHEHRKLTTKHNSNHNVTTEIEHSTDKIENSVSIRLQYEVSAYFDPLGYNKQNIEPSVSELDKHNFEQTNKTGSVSSVSKVNNKREVNKPKLKYILEWTPSYSTPFFVLRKGRASFVANGCKHTNCYITDNRNYLPNVTDFDAIMFSSCEANFLEQRHLPQFRSPEQKYVFVSTEPAPKQLILHTMFDNFFNWTWTYRLDSDVTWKYFTIYNVRGKAVGPAFDMKWPTKFRPINAKLKKKLRSKFKIAAWFVSHCYQYRKRFAQKVEFELQKYGLEVDTYGKCGKYKCGSYKDSKACFKMLENNYYFYLAFENSLDDDYVTEKVLTAFDNYVVPVVYGGANYSRFLPPGSYLDARALGPEMVAKTMNDIIHNATLYHNFFRWRSHFKYRSTWSGKEICNICTALNNEPLVKKTSVYPDFRVWWNHQQRMTLYKLILDFHRDRENVSRMPNRRSPMSEYLNSTTLSKETTSVEVFE